MTPARWTFVLIFGIGLLLGIYIGASNLIDPNSANISLNGQKVTGLTGLWTAIASSTIPSLLIGLIVSGIVSLFTRRKKT